MDPTEPGLAARGVLRASAKQTSQSIVTQAAAGGRRRAMPMTSNQKPETRN
jgi:hypothetical protein